MKLTIQSIQLSQVPEAYKNKKENISNNIKKLLKYYNILLRNFTTLSGIQNIVLKPNKKKDNGNISKHFLIKKK